MHIGLWERFLDNWDALLCPAATVTAFRHCPKGTPLPVDGTPVEYWTILDHCRPFSLAGHPVVVMPVSTDRGGLPIGVKVYGLRWEDERLLAIAARLPEVAGPFQRAPGY